jgi:hypothetical protein
MSIFKKPAEKIQVSLNLTRTRGTLHKDRYTIMTVLCSVLLKIKSVSDKSSRENQNTQQDGVSSAVKNTTNKEVEYFITKTTCFGPCTGPSSGLKLCLEGDYTV